MGRRMLAHVEVQGRGVCGQICDSCAVRATACHLYRWLLRVAERVFVRVSSVHTLARRALLACSPAACRAVEGKVDEKG